MRVLKLRHFHRVVRVVVPANDSNRFEKPANRAKIPPLSQEQRLAGIEASLILRRQRRDVKMMLKNRLVELDLVLDFESVQGMRVRDLIRALEGYGPRRTDRLMQALGLKPTTVVKRLSKAHRERLLELGHLVIRQADESVTACAKVVLAAAPSVTVRSGRLALQSLSQFGTDYRPIHHKLVTTVDFTLTRTNGRRNVTYVCAR